MGAVALAVYLLYNWTFLIPVHFDITDRLIGQGTDPLAWIWFYSWFPYALTQGSNPLISAVVWVPGGLNLTWTKCTMALAILCWPITTHWGACVTYNVIVLTAPALAAWMAYFLCREITGMFFPALFGGWLFGFSSYELGQLLGHVDLFVNWPVPLLAWLAVRWYRKKLSDRAFVILATITLFIELGISIEVFATTVLFGFTTLLIAYHVLPDPTAPRRLTRLMIYSTIILPAVCLLALPFLGVMLFGPDHPYRSIYSPAVFSTDLANILIPTGTTWLDNGLLALLFGPMAGNISEQGAYIALPLLVMWILYIRSYWRTGTGKLVIVAAAMFMVFSLGPWLTILDHRFSIPLPWAIFTHLPLIKDALPARFTLYVWLATAVMAAMWMAQSQSHWIFKLALTGATVLFLFPNLERPSLWCDVPTIPMFFQHGQYQHYIRRNENVLLLPTGPDGEAVFIQAHCNFYFHIVGGYLGPPPPRMHSNHIELACFYGGQVSATARQVLHFFHHAKIGAVVISPAEATVFQWLLSPLHIHPIEVGGVDFYEIKSPVPTNATHRSAGPVLPKTG